MLLKKYNPASKYAVRSVTVITSRQKLLNHVSRSTAAAQLTALSLSPQSFCSWSLLTIALIHLLTHLCSPLLPGLDKLRGQLDNENFHFFRIIARKRHLCNKYNCTSVFLAHIAIGWLSLAHSVTVTLAHSDSL